MILIQNKTNFSNISYPKMLSIKSKKQCGMTLIEVMLSVLILGLVVAGMSQFFIAQQQNNRQQDAQLELNETLRVGMMRISSDLRNAKFITPKKNLDNWVTWISGFTSNPKITAANGTLTQQITMLSANPNPISSLTADTSSGQERLYLSDSTGFNTTNRRLLSVNSHEFALAIDDHSSTHIHVDTNPILSGTQYLANPYLTGTAIYLVEARTYFVDTSNNTLQINKYDGTGPQILLENVSNLQITEITPGQHYRITLTAVTEGVDIDTGARLSRSISSEVALVN